MFNSDIAYEIRVHYFSNPEEYKDFEKLYLNVRRKENRIYTDEIVKNLPVINKENPLFNEWQMRKTSLDKLISYLKRKSRPIRIMELGCGNGWLANHLSKISLSEVDGVDINKTELEQATRVFNESLNLKFIYGNISDNIFENEAFDFIIASSCIQYFFDLRGLIRQLLKLLKNEGELHILDSSLYRTSEVPQAQKRTEQYYSNLNYPEMSSFYHHHSFDELSEFKYIFIYDPNSFSNKMRNRIFPNSHSPFPWIKILKQKLPHGIKRKSF